MANNSGNNVFNSLSLLSSADVVLTLPPSELNFMGKGMGGGGCLQKYSTSQQQICMSWFSQPQIFNPTTTNKDVLV